MANDVLRSFFAIGVDEAARRAAVLRIRALGECPGGDAVRWVAPENLHVTLRFMGDVERSALPELAEAVRRATASVPGFTLRLGGVRIFPSRRRPVAVTLDLEPEAPLRDLAGAIERGVRAAGFAAEKRPFRSHLTLGRVRRGKRSAFPEPSEEFEAPLDVACEIERAGLFRSEFSPEGARYTVLEEFSLAASEPGG